MEIFTFCAVSNTYKHGILPTSKVKLYLRIARKNSCFIEFPREKEKTTTVNLFHTMSLSFISLSESYDSDYKTMKQ